MTDEKTTKSIVEACEKEFTELNLSSNNLTELPMDIFKFTGTKLNLSSNKLMHLPPEIAKLTNLTELNLSSNKLMHLPPEIAKLTNLTELNLSSNSLKYLPSEITELTKLKKLDLSKNPLILPTPKVVSMGIEAIFTHLKQSKISELNEAMLIIVGNREVGKTCLSNCFIKIKSVMGQSSEWTCFSKCKIPGQRNENTSIGLNVWDLGKMEVEHSTHNLFLIKNSIYLLVWNARKTTEDKDLHYWLHMIKSFGGDSPIFLVMSKMSERNADLDMNKLKSIFPQISESIKIDSVNKKNISFLMDMIKDIAEEHNTALKLPLVRAPWVEPWTRVKRRLEELNIDWITYEEFCDMCNTEGLEEEEEISVLEEFLLQLGSILLLKGRYGNKVLVILNHKWFTEAYYKIWYSESVKNLGGILLHSVLSQIWDTRVYPLSIHYIILELMERLELIYELKGEDSHLVPELLPKSEPDDFSWDKEGNLCFYYCYDYFLPPDIIPRFIVWMYQDIEKKENGLPLCWREGAVLRLQNSRAFVKLNPDEMQIEIRIKGDNVRGVLEVICYHIDHINEPIKGISVVKKIRCNCVENCTEKYIFDKLKKAEKDNFGKFQCHESNNNIQISSLLNGYRREDSITQYDETSKQLVQNFFVNSNNKTSLEANQISKTEQITDIITNIKIDIKIDLKIELPQIKTEFGNLKDELESKNPKLDNDLDKIQDSLDEISTNSDKEKLAKPFNKLYRLLDKFNDPNSDYNKVITGTQKGIELAQKVGRTYNKFAQWLAMPQVPDILVGKS